MSRYYLPRMKGREWGRIVHKLAVARGLAETTASEGATGFVEQMAAARKITRAEVEKEFFRSVRQSSLLQGFACVEEVAAMVAFVRSPLSSATNGAALRVDGGVVQAIV